MGDLVGQAGGRKGVTSVALTVPSVLTVTGSPITSTGTLAVSLATQNANLVFAGPSSGGAATPTFRSLVVGDIPVLDDARLANAVILAPATSARNIIQPSGAAVIPLTVKGFVSQSANLQEWQDSNGAALVTITKDGNIVFIGGAAHQIVNSGGGLLLQPAGSGASGSVMVRGANTGAVTLITRMVASQTATIQEWQNSAGIALALINSSGGFFAGPITSQAGSAGLILNSRSGAGVPIQIYNPTGADLRFYANVNIAILAATGALMLGSAAGDGGTNTVANMLTLNHYSAGAVVAGFGTGLVFQGQSSTTASRDMGRVRTEWNVATDASRSADLIGSAYYLTNEREGWRVRGGSSGAQLGFFGATPVDKPTVTGSRGSNAALASLLTQLAALGLIVDSSS